MPMLREYREKHIIVLGGITILRSYEITSTYYSSEWYNHIKVIQTSAA